MYVQFFYIRKNIFCDSKTLSTAMAIYHQLSFFLFGIRHYLFSLLSVHAGKC